MDTLNSLAYGFSVLFQFYNLLFCFLGVLFGTLIGVLPGIGPVGAMALLLSITYGMNPVTSIIMLAGLLLWRHVWWGDHVHPDENTGGGGIGGHLSRRL